MMRYGKQIGTLTMLLAAAAFTAAIAIAQMPQQQPQQPQPGQQPGQTSPQAEPSAPPLIPPVNAEEEAAFKTFHETNPQEADKKDKLAEDFIAKYPQSRYAPEPYNWLVRAYYSKGEVDKMEATADKELAMYPNDPQTLSLVCTSLPRAMNASTPEPEKRLAKAEKYCQKALDILPTVPKPEGMPDEAFQELKGQTESMAYSGLGMVAFRRGKFDAAIPNFESAIKADSKQPDAVNYYVLGLANEKASHFDAAVTAFTKCADIQGRLQPVCKQNIDEAKKQAATQLSAPK